MLILCLFTVIRFGDKRLSEPTWRDEVARFGGGGSDGDHVTMRMVLVFDPLKGSKQRKTTRSPRESFGLK